MNEAYLRLVKLDQVDWQDRTHFFVVAARQMRRILVELGACARRSKARVVELRFFGGLTNTQIAAALGVSNDTVTRDGRWRSCGCSESSGRTEPSDN